MMLDALFLFFPGKKGRFPTLLDPSALTLWRSTAPGKWRRTGLGQRVYRTPRGYHRQNAATDDFLTYYRSFLHDKNFRSLGLIYFDFISICCNLYHLHVFYYDFVSK